jgi:hypothetical protein
MCKATKFTTSLPPTKSELKELLTNTFGENVSYPNDQFRKLELEPLKEELLKCDEFSECDEIVIMKYPVTLDENNNSIETKTYKVVPNQKFKGKCYLLSLALTPEMFDPKKIHEPVLDGACITPTIYDPETFEPKKKIVLEFSPEVAQDQYIYGLGSPSMIEDAEKNGEVILRKQLHETLDKILDNPENYQIKGEKGVMVRGAFEVVESNSGVEKKELFGLNTDKITHASVFFFEKDLENSKEGEMNLKLSKINIPIELKEKYESELGAKSIHVTREEVEEFLEKNISYDTKNNTIFRN